VGGCDVVFGVGFPVVNFGGLWANGDSVNVMMRSLDCPTSGHLEALAGW